ncbi:MAG: hypothetical protein ACYC6M_04970 [Terriglobales bacterium]
MRLRYSNLLHQKPIWGGGGSSSTTPQAFAAQQIVAMLPANVANPTVDQVTAAITALLPTWPASAGVLSPAQLASAVQSVATNVPPDPISYADAIALSVAQSVAANTPAGSTDQVVAQQAVLKGSLQVAADAAADTGQAWWQVPGADLTPVGCNSNGDQVNAEGMPLTGAGLARCTPPATAGLLQIQPPTATTNWLPWALGGSAVLGGYLLFRRKKVAP